MDKRKYLVMIVLGAPLLMNIAITIVYNSINVKGHVRTELDKTS